MRQRFIENHLISLVSFKLTHYNLHAIFMCKYSNHLLPMTFRNFVRSSDVHCHGTRSSSDLRSDPARATLKSSSLKCSGPCLYSNIPMIIKSTASIRLFKINYNCWIYHLFVGLKCHFTKHYITLNKSFAKIMSYYFIRIHKSSSGRKSFRIIYFDCINLIFPGYILKACAFVLAQFNKPRCYVM